MTTSNNKVNRLTKLLAGRVGNVLTGFYCGYSAPSVAHWLVYTELRRDRKSRPLVNQLPYFQEWRELRTQMTVSERLLSFPHLKELKTQSVKSINASIVVNRMNPAPVETLEGMQAMVSCASETRADGATFDTFFDAVCLEANTLMDDLDLVLVKDDYDQQGDKQSRLLPTSAITTIA